MPIDRLVDNPELLKRVLEHYKYRLDSFTNDADVKERLSGPVRRHLTFGRLKSTISEALNELTSDSSTANSKLSTYSDLVMSAARQYLKDLERIKEKASQDLPDAKLAELESDIDALKACLL